MIHIKHKLFLILSVVALAGLVLAAFFFVRPHTINAPLHADIVLTDKGFTPEEVTIALHGTVTFSTTLQEPFWPASNPHPWHTLYHGFDPMQPIAPNRTWSFTFDKPGDWGFHDHLRSYFLGTVHVID